LEEGLFPTMEVLFPEGFTLQQDNASCHVSKDLRKFFMTRGLGGLASKLSRSKPHRKSMGSDEEELGALHPRPSLKDWRNKLEKI